MKKCVYILLLVTLLVPLAARARTETMAERKRRIERKYLQEHAELVQSDAVVPAEVAVGEEEILDSEKFKEPQVNFQKQEAGTPVPPRPRAPRLRKENPNWLLAETPGEEGEDSAADPFAWDTSSSDTKKKKPERSSEWRRRDVYSNTDRQREGWFSRRSDSAGSGTFDTQGSSFGTTPPEGSSPYSAIGGRSLFGQRGQQGDQTAPSLFGNSTGTKPFSATSGQNPFKTQFPSQTGSAGTDEAETRQQGYTPYKSPYQTQRSQQQGGAAPYRQEFQRQDNFQKWKEKSPQQLDPMRDDAFIDDLMPKIRR